MGLAARPNTAMHGDHHQLNSQCSICNSEKITLFFEAFQIPVHCNLLWPSQSEARQAPKGDMQLGFCENCCHIFNIAFDPALMEYTQAYENSLHFSTHFQSYAEGLAKQLVESHNLYDKTIVEIGCGQADFLKMVCVMGNNRGVGFDPSYIPKPDGLNGAVKVIQDFYSEKYADYQADLICCRHVLEHIQAPRDFIASIRRSIGDRHDTVVFFEVPNALYTLRDLGIWDLIYEHCSYFSIPSISRLFELCGFAVKNATETYHSQFLCIEAKPIEGPVSDAQLLPSKMATLVSAFAKSYQKKVTDWRKKLNDMTTAGQRVVVWGGGSKGVTFLNVMHTQDQISYVVDINPRKQGMYVAGTGQQYVGPEFLREYPPDVIIIMNAVYMDEIKRQTQSLGLSPKFMTV